MRTVDELREALESKSATIECWQEYPVAIQALQQIRDGMSSNGRYASTLLFRGLSDATWPLTSTLERHVQLPDYTWHDYHRDLLEVQPELEAFTHRQWDLPPLPLADKLIDQRFLDYIQSSDTYGFMAHLRHHGFPSPLLDWTRSPYIAAHFAISRNAQLPAAVYAFLEFAGKGKGSSHDRPAIFGMGPVVRTHERHFRQQCEYTVCNVNASKSYSAHEAIFSLPPGDPQDLLWKIELTPDAIAEGIEYLQTHNIGSFTLFNTEEALLQDLATRILA